MKILIINDWKTYSGAEKIIHSLIENSNNQFKLLVKPSSILFRKVLKDFKPDIINFHNIIRTGLLPILIALKQNIPIVHSLHDYWLVCKNLHHFIHSRNELCSFYTWNKCICKEQYSGSLPLPPLVFNLYKKNNIKLIVPSNAFKELLMKFNYKKENIKVIYHGIKLKDEPVEDKNFILSIVPKFPWKGYHIIKILEKELPLYSFKIVGTELGRLDPSIPGYIPEDQLRELQRTCSLLVFPSIWEEPCGLVHLEAMRYKKVVLAFNIGATKEYIKERIVPYLDCDGMKKNIIKLMEDSTLRKKLGLKNYKNMINNKFTDKDMYNRYFEYFKSILEEKK